MLTPPGHAQEAGEPSSVPAAATLAGEYVHREMELVAGLHLGKDGQFLFGLIVGSLDQEARGRWEADGRRIRLTSDPRPVAPTITASRTEATPNQPFAIRLLGPAERDVPGVDLRIEFDSGAPLDSYMAGGPRSLPDGEKRVPRFVTFGISSHQIEFPRMPIDPRPGTTAIFDFTPNDFGVVDLTDAVATVDGDTLTLTYAMGTLRMRRIEDD